MKLSELSTDRALDALCELTPYVSSICTDEDLVSSVGEQINAGENANVYGLFMILARKVGEIAPILLRTHRADVYGILSILNEKDVAEIAAQPIMDTIQQIREAFEDTGLLSFFKSFGRRERSGRSAPSAPSRGSE